MMQIFFNLSVFVVERRWGWTERRSWELSWWQSSETVTLDPCDTFARRSGLCSLRGKWRQKTRSRRLQSTFVYVHNTFSRYKYIFAKRQLLYLLNCYFRMVLYIHPTKNVKTCKWNWTKWTHRHTSYRCDRCCLHDKYLTRCNIYLICVGVMFLRHCVHVDA